MSHYGIRPFRVFLRSPITLRQPQLAGRCDVVSGRGFPTLSIKGATQRHCDIQKPLLASHPKPLTNSLTNNWPPRCFRQTPSISHSSRLQGLFDTTMAAAMQSVPASEGDAVRLCSCGNKISCKDTHQVSSAESSALSWGEQLDICVPLPSVFSTDEEEDALDFEEEGQSDFLLPEEEEDFEDYPFLPPTHTAQPLAAAGSMEVPRCSVWICKMCANALQRS